MIALSEMLICGWMRGQVVIKVFYPISSRRATLPFSCVNIKAGGMIVSLSHSMVMVLTELVGTSMERSDM